MAVFVSFSDESAGSSNRDRFYRAGFVAPEKDWSDYFAPAWQERVLDGPPKIPYLHMTDIRDADFCRKYGLSKHEAQGRVDEALDIIRTTGSLIPVCQYVNAGTLRDRFNDTGLIGRKGSQMRQYVMEPDYLCFIGFAFGSLVCAHELRPDCEKVDFVVEKSGTTDRLGDFYKGLPEALRQYGHPHLVKLVGELIPLEKKDNPAERLQWPKRIPLQATDVLCWYTQRNRNEMLSDRDRLAMFHTLKGKRGYFQEWNDGQLLSIASTAIKVDHMKDMYEGKEAFDRFDGLMKKIISVPHAEVKRRVEEERKKAASNPNKRGPKPKRKPAKASASRASGGGSKHA